MFNGHVLFNSMYIGTVGVLSIQEYEYSEFVETYI